MTEEKNTNDLIRLREEHRGEPYHADENDYGYFDDLDDLDDLADEAETDQEEDAQDEAEDDRAKNSLLERALSANVLTIWHLQGLVRDMIGEDFPDDTIAHPAAEVMLKGTNMILAEMSATKIVNPIVIFEKHRKAGDYDSMSDRDYDRLKSRTEKLGGCWKNMPECDLMTLCLRMLDRQKS